MWDVIGDPANKLGELCTAVMGSNAAVLVAAQASVLYGIVLAVGMYEWIRRRRNAQQTAAVVPAQPPQHD
jgi:uncharacterized iron-regulated membrane protein